MGNRKKLMEINNKVLLLIDNKGVNIKQILGANINAGDDCHLLTFGFAAREILRDTNHNVRLPDMRGISKRAENEARQYYIELTSKLPTNKIFDLLAWKDRNLWWYLNLSEKNIWLSKIIHRLYALLRLYYLIEQESFDKVILCLNDRLLKQAIIELLSKRDISYADQISKASNYKLNDNLLVFSFRYFLANLRVFFGKIVQLLLLKLNGIKSKPRLAEGTRAFFSIYPIWWHEPFSAAPREMFFHNVNTEEQSNEQSCYLLWLMAGSKMMLNNLRNFIAFLRNKKCIVLEQFLSFSDLFLVFNIAKFVKIIEVFRASASLRFTIKDINISSLVQDELRRSLSSAMLTEWLLLDKALSKAPLTKFKSLFFRLEFQPLERALLFNTRGKTISVGFQHSALGKNFMNYVFAKDEFLGGMPLPDYILTTGKIGFDYMKFAGYPEDRINVIGALRYTHLFQYLTDRPPKEALRAKYGISLSTPVIFVATSTSLSETVSMLEDLLAAFKYFQQPFHVIVKFHPNAKGDASFLSTIRALFEKEDANCTFECFISMPSLYDYISLSDIVFSTGSTVSLEAMILGVVPVTYNCSAQLVHNPLADYPEAAPVVDSAESIVPVLSNLNSCEGLDSLNKGWPQLLAYLLDYHVSNRPKERFFELVRSIKVTKNREV